MARGADTFADEWIDDKIGVSEYPLSASVACGKVRRSLLPESLQFLHLLFSSAVPWKNSGTLSSFNLRRGSTPHCSWYSLD